MLKPREVLRNNGLSSWSQVSENTRGYLSQVPWIREKVQPHEKDAHALRGIWSTTEPRYINSPEPGGSELGNSPDIDLEAGVQIPEFSLRIIDESGPPSRPIEEVLDDIRKSFKVQNDPRAAINPSVGKNIDPNPISRLGRHSENLTLQDQGDHEDLPWVVPPSTEVGSQSLLPTIGNAGSSGSRQKSDSMPQMEKPQIRARTRLIPKPQRQGSADSQKYELQIFPGEIVTDKNWGSIQQGLPESIRDHCTFKDDYWWFDGDASILSGLSTLGRSSDMTPGIATSKQSSQPIIQKGSITIAGRPLLLERCFTRRPSAAWHCKPNDLMMTGSPIPGFKDGETVVVPLACIPAPPNMKWTDEDPLGQKNIDPRSVSEDELNDIAKHVGPYKFCLYLDGTLQIMLSKKQLGKRMRFPRKIGGLNVCFSKGVVSSTFEAPAESSISKLVQVSTSILLGVSSMLRVGKDTWNRHETKTEKSSSSNVAPLLMNDDVPNLSENSPGLIQNEELTPRSSSPMLQQQSQNGSNGRLSVPIGMSDAASGSGSLSIPPELTSTSPTPQPIPSAHVPCEVIVGESIELGVSCFVGVKVRDGGIEKITVPTSAALEAACKARRASGKVARIRKCLSRDTGVSVLNLGIWTKAMPQNKIGTITRCFDSENGRSLTIHSVHPDDLLYDVCLVEGEGTEPFAAITSPCSQWWVKYHQALSSQIVQNTLLHIVCPQSESLREPAVAVDGPELESFASKLPDKASNAVRQGLLVVPYQHLKKSKHRPKRTVQKTVLCTSTLYRFLGAVGTSYDQYRGAAVVQVRREARLDSWESVVGLHSFEYMVDMDGYSEKAMNWDQIRRAFLDGSLSFWGCRHLPHDLTNMDLIST